MALHTKQPAHFFRSCSQMKETTRARTHPTIRIHHPTTRSFVAVWNLAAPVSRYSFAYDEPPPVTAAGTQKYRPPGAGALNHAQQRALLAVATVAAFVIKA